MATTASLDTSGAPTMIEITAEPTRSVRVKFVGVEYDVHVPKASLALRLARQAAEKNADGVRMIDALYIWADSAFGEKAEEIRARLDDPTDDLDIIHLTKLMEAMTEVASNGYPTP
jgi:hypothetical protein